MTKKSCTFLTCHPWRIAICTVLSALLIAAGLFFWHHHKKAINQTIAADIEQLSTLFGAINHDCEILGFDHDVNYVDFLTIGTFNGSRVGALHLKKPENWKGPFVKENPTVQDKIYEIIKTAQGYFLVPGTGVVLTDGRVIGRDIMLNQETGLQALVDDGTLRTADGKPLAARITIAQ